MVGGVTDIVLYRSAVRPLVAANGNGDLGVVLAFSTGDSLLVVANGLLGPNG